MPSPSTNAVEDTTKPEILISEKNNTSIGDKPKEFKPITTTEETKADQILLESPAIDSEKNGDTTMKNLIPQKNNDEEKNKNVNTDQNLPKEEKGVKTEKEILSIVFEKPKDKVENNQLNEQEKPNVQKSNPKTETKKDYSAFKIFCLILAVFLVFLAIIGIAMLQ